ncbi:hypothetical protein BDR07DRAFT_451197 [Suillus spraguei]|nr:hypothetical protein BDR07DRAFT_451197 [Suillus spraguei]
MVNCTICTCTSKLLPLTPIVSVLGYQSQSFDPRLCLSNKLSGVTHNGYDTPGLRISL